jgi:flagellar biosynthesis protein FlhG
LAKSRIDQADGLRRLLDREGLRIVSVSAAGRGGSDIGATINLAAALAEIGSDVLILDEWSGLPKGAGALGLNVRFNLEDLLGGSRPLDDMIVHGPAGIRILPLARCGLSLSQLPESERRRLTLRLKRLGNPVDTLLVDAAPGRASTLLSGACGAREVIVLAGGGASEITAAYALIKRLSNEFARREFHVLVGNVASEDRARGIVGHMAGVARHYLRVSLDFMGHVPPDEKLLHAAHLRLPIVAAFPGAAAAGSFRSLAQAVANWPRDADGAGVLDDVTSRFIHSHSPRAAAA